MRSLLFAVSFLLVQATSAPAVFYSTPNFIVSASDDALAEKIGKRAEALRKSIALEWVGKELSPWAHRGLVEVTRGSDLKSFGFTSFDGSYRHCLMVKVYVEGSEENILKNVLPHELTHAVLGSFFGTPLPPWASEGSSILMEEDQQRMFREVLSSLKGGRCFELKTLFNLDTYPKDRRLFYAQSWSLAKFLVDKGGKQKFLQFVQAAMFNAFDGWESALRKHYEFDSIDNLHEEWKKSVLEEVKRRKDSL